MKFTETSVTTQKEILKRKLGGELFEEITLDSTAFTNGVCNGTIAKAFACVNEANANANAGITIAASVKTALSLIVFE